MLELTALNGDAIMCVVFFAGIRDQAVVDTGMEIFVHQEGKVSDKDFFVKNRGANKQFPWRVRLQFLGQGYSMFDTMVTKKDPSLHIYCLILYILLTIFRYSINRREG